MAFGLVIANLNDLAVLSKHGILVTMVGHAAEVHRSKDRPARCRELDELETVDRAGVSKGPWR